MVWNDQGIIIIYSSFSWQLLTSVVADKCCNIVFVFEWLLFTLFEQCLLILKVSVSVDKTLMWETAYYLINDGHCHLENHSCECFITRALSVATRRLSDKMFMLHYGRVYHWATSQSRLTWGVHFVSMDVGNRCTTRAQSVTNFECIPAGVQLVKWIKGVDRKIEGSFQAGGGGYGWKNMKINRHCNKADLPTLKSVKPEHLFMLWTWNSEEWPSDVLTMEGGSGGPSPDIFKKTRLQMLQSVILELYLWIKGVPGNLKKTRLQVLQSELLWSFICE